MRIKKYIVISFFALGVLCFPIELFTIEYHCVGQEVFPIFYGSPFIYKSTSLATSLAYDYYLTGIIGCWLTWIILFSFIWFLFDKFLSSIDSKFLKYIYETIIGLLIIVSALSLIFTITSAGSGLKWHLDINKLSKDWGMDCMGEFKWVAN